jgi:hypothetical protein
VRGIEKRRIVNDVADRKNFVNLRERLLPVRKQAWVKLKMTGRTEPTY